MPVVNGRIVLRVIAHQCLRERGREGFNVLGERLAVLELELRRATFFHGKRSHMSVGGRVPQDLGAEVLIDTNPGTPERYIAADRLPEPIIDRSLALGDSSMSLRGERGCQMEHSRDVGMSVIEGQEIHGGA